MFIESHKMALSSFKTDIDLYMVDGVVADDEGVLSLMLPLARNAIAIKFAEDDPIVAKMVAHAFIMFEGLCTSEQAYAFYSDLVSSPKVYDRVMQFVTMMLMVDEPLGTLALSKGVNKKHGKLLSDVRLVGEFYDKDLYRRHHSDGSSQWYD